MNKQKVIWVDGHQHPHGDRGAVIPETTEARQNVEVGDEAVLRFAVLSDIEFLRCPVELGGQDEIDWVNAHANNDTIVISCHHNACDDERASGVEAFYYNGNARGQKLAEMICERIASKTGQKNRGAKIESQSQHKSIGIISKTKGTAVLVECGFLTNSYDKKHILDPTLDNAFSEAIFEAVAEFLGLEVVVTPELKDDPLEEQKKIIAEIIEKTRVALSEIENFIEDL